MVYLIQHAVSHSDQTIALKANNQDREAKSTQMFHFDTGTQTLTPSRHECSL